MKSASEKLGDKDISLELERILKQLEELNLITETVSNPKINSYGINSSQNNIWFVNKIYFFLKIINVLFFRHLILFCAPKSKWLIGRKQTENL